MCVLVSVCQNVHGQDARFNLTNVKVGQAAMVLQDFTGETVVLASDVQGTVTLFSSKTVDKREAMAMFAAALRAQGLTLHSADGEAVVTRAASASPAPRTDRERDSAIGTRIFTLQHLGVAEASPGVRTLLSKRGAISAKDNSTLIVSDKSVELLKITQHLMAADRAKEFSAAQQECARVMDAAGVLQRHFAAGLNKTLIGAASDEQWGRQLQAVTQTLEEGAVCAGVADLVTPVERRPITVSATALPNQGAGLRARGGPAEGVLVSKIKGATQQLEAVPKTDTSPDDATLSELGSVVEHWREAWSRRDVATYLGFYASDFLPSSERQRSIWTKKRKLALTRAVRISVDIADLSITLSDATHATMVFTQTYRSNNYRDVMVKTLQWVREESRWLITQEGEVIR